MLSEGEFLFIYNSNQLEDKRARGYAITIDKLKINEIDIHKDHLTPKQIAEIADILDVSIGDLYREGSRSAYEQFTDEELIKVLAQDASKMRTPIVLSKEASFFVGSSFELIKEKLETYEIQEEHANKSER
ncbi:hypothetical protein C7460_101236 [Marinoscillum furvescens DSM 4134]|uniref:Arsenate reductase-like glutaredoxin family protein n=2 Tax=Marinoscillum furvescens TaxID=1026 RepID=A0A3D9LGE8_MARFU|nr:hypothetical protein C7460_101236 [Marinoscillum furvescens DSM 4134]